MDLNQNYVYFTVYFTNTQINPDKKQKNTKVAQESSTNFHSSSSTPPEGKSPKILGFKDVTLSIKNQKILTQ